MKKHKILLAILSISLLGSSCDSYLDINDNPNSAIYVQPSLILPGAIVTTASSQVSYNGYGGSLVGYQTNAGGFSGFGNFLTYDLVPGSYSQWGTYDNLLDYKYVIDQTEGDQDYAHFNAAARVLTVYQFHKLVDQHNNIPYTEALQGKNNTAPKYDEGPEIYQDLIKKLDSAITLFNSIANPIHLLTQESDPLFRGNIVSWKKLANTIKLRLLIRISEVPSLKSYASAQFTTLDTDLGFLTDDAIVNPGYVQDRPNPTWATWGYNIAGNAVATSRVPSYFVYGYYDGNKITDTWRGSVVFNDFGNATRPTPLNQLGNESGNPAVRSGYSTWYTGTRASASSITNALGIVKGPTQGQPIFLAAEAYLLQAEAQVRGLLPGNATSSFEEGIKASFRYLYKNVSGTVETGKNVNTDFAAYKNFNSSSFLVNLDIATTTEQKIEAIITQKYIAFNQITGEEAWNDYRRTGYPKTSPTGDRYNNFASITSNATAADRLPTIIRYPQSEYNFNSGNVTDVNHFTDKVFWAR